MPSWMEGVVANELHGHAATEDETPAEIAAKLNVDVRQLVHLSKEWYPSLHAHCKLLAGTVVQVPDTPGALPGNYVYPVDEEPVQEDNDDDQQPATWYQRRIVDKYSPTLSRSELRQLALSAGVVNLRWANTALKLSERKRATAALKRQKTLRALEPGLIEYYSDPEASLRSLASTDTGGPQIITFYSRKAQAKRKGVPVSALNPNKAKKAKKEKKEKKKGPVRPINAYVLFLRDNRAKVVAANPGVGMGEITKLCATKWRELAPEARAPFDEQAKADRARYEREMEQWRKDHPAPVQVVTSLPAPPKEEPPADSDGWTIELDAQRGEQYFWHAATQASSWTHPVTGKFPDGSSPLRETPAPEDAVGVQSDGAAAAAAPEETILISEGTAAAGMEPPQGDAEAPLPIMDMDVDEPPAVETKTVPVLPAVAVMPAPAGAVPAAAPSPAPSPALPASAWS